MLPESVTRCHQVVAGKYRLLAHTLDSSLDLTLCDTSLHQIGKQRVKRTGGLPDIGFRRQSQPNRKTAIVATKRVIICSCFRGDLLLHHQLAVKPAHSTTVKNLGQNLQRIGRIAGRSLIWRDVMPLNIDLAHIRILHEESDFGSLCGT